MSDGPEIREHMVVVGSDGQHVGTVDRLERGHIKLTKEDDPGGAGEHRAVPLGLIASTEGDLVRLTVPAQRARALAVGGLDPRDVVEDGTVPVHGFESAAERAAGTGAGVMDDRASTREGWERKGGVFVHHTAAERSIAALRRLGFAGGGPAAASRA